MYAAGACVILILVIMGVSLFNSFDRMKSVQNTLGFLDKETVASDGKTSEETTDDGSVPTSAEIEAVKGQTDADSADENKTKEESVSGQTEKMRKMKIRKTACLRAMIKKNRREAILRRGQMNRLLEARTVRTGFIL